MNKVVQIKKRPDFLRIARTGQKIVKSGLVLQALRRAGDGEENIRIGFTASKKVGKAVRRNRAKRRLRVLAASLLPSLGLAGYDYVLIARYKTVDGPFEKLYGDLKDALEQVKNEKNDPEQKDDPSAFRTS